MKKKNNKAATGIKKKDRQKRRGNEKENENYKDKDNDNDNDDIFLYQNNNTSHGMKKNVAVIVLVMVVIVIVGIAFMKFSNQSSIGKEEYLTFDSENNEKQAEQTSQQNETKKSGRRKRKRRRERQERRTEMLPLLDQLFPYQSVDKAWEKYPLLSTIYDEEYNNYHNDDQNNDNDDQSQERQCTVDDNEGINSNEKSSVDGTTSTSCSNNNDDENQEEMDKSTIMKRKQQQQQQQRRNNQIPTVYISEKSMTTTTTETKAKRNDTSSSLVQEPTYQSRLEFAQKLISISDVWNHVLDPSWTSSTSSIDGSSRNKKKKDASLSYGDDYQLVKKIIRDGEEWTGTMPDSYVKTLQSKIGAVQRGGFSLIVNQLQKRWHEVAKVAHQLTDEISPEHVSCNLYLTPAPEEEEEKGMTKGDDSNNSNDNVRRQSGFESHWDWMDVIVIQIAGTKLWSVGKVPKIYLSTQDQKYKPTINDMNEYTNYDTGRYSEFYLRPGDVLYIPRGYIHNASTVTTAAAAASSTATRTDNNYDDVRQPSLHLTFGIEYNCQSTVEALIHHAIDSYATNNVKKTNGDNNDNNDSKKNKEQIAIPKRNCPEAGGHRDILWKDILHFIVAEVARRENVCNHNNDDGIDDDEDDDDDDKYFSRYYNRSPCLLRRSIPMTVPFQQIFRDEFEDEDDDNDSGYGTNHNNDYDDDKWIYNLLQDAIDTVKVYADPIRTSQLIHNLENRIGESVHKFCHPFLSWDTTVPCYAMIRQQIPKDSIVDELTKIQSFISMTYNNDDDTTTTSNNNNTTSTLKSYQRLINHVQNLQRISRQDENEILMAIGQLPTDQELIN